MSIGRLSPEEAGDVATRAARLLARDPNVRLEVQWRYAGERLEERARGSQS